MEKNLDIIFLGLGKNIENSISNLFNFLDTLATKKKKKILFVIGENDSKDNSEKVINNFISRNNNNQLQVIYLKTNLIKKISNRILRIAKGREYLKEYIKEKQFKSKYIAIIDLDEVINTQISEDKFANLLEDLEKNKKDLFGISVRSKPYYYDLLAFYVKDYFEKNVYKIQTSKNFFLSFYNRKNNVYNFQKKINNFKEIKCISCHNGLTIYHFNDYYLGSYINFEGTPFYSDHGNLNYQIYNKTKKHILLSNKLYLKTPEEHMPLTFKSFIFKAITKYLIFLK